MADAGRLSCRLAGIARNDRNLSREILRQFQDFRGIRNRFMKRRDQLSGLSDENFTPQPYCRRTRFRAISVLRDARAQSLPRSAAAT